MKKKEEDTMTFHVLNNSQSFCFLWREEFKRSLDILEVETLREVT